MLNRDYSKLKRMLFGTLMLLGLVLITSILVLDLLFIHHGPSMQGGTVIDPTPVPSDSIMKDEYEFGEEMEIDIFDLYFLEESVSSSNGEKVIAPGTRNEHTLFVTNNFDFALDFTISYDSSFANDVVLPLLVKLRNDEGEYLIGSENEYGKVEDLVNISDHNTVGGKRYHYYVFEWYWPFESGEDENDTYLGDLTVTSSVKIELDISVGAVASENVDSKDGIMLPTNKDVVAGQAFALITVVAVALLVIITAVVGRRKRVYHSEY